MEHLYLAPYGLCVILWVIWLARGEEVFACIIQIVILAAFVAFLGWLLGLSVLWQCVIVVVLGAMTMVPGQNYPDDPAPSRAANDQ